MKLAVIQSEFSVLLALSQMGIYGFFALYVIDRLEEVKDILAVFCCACCKSQKTICLMFSLSLVGCVYPSLYWFFHPRSKGGKKNFKINLVTCLDQDYIPSHFW